jgi:hypothetical protein
MKKKGIWAIVVVGAAAMALSCEPSGSTGPATGPGPSKVARLGSLRPTPLVCPSSTTESTTGVVGPMGGVLSVGGTTVSIPAGALLDTVTLTLSVPASNNVEIDVSVAGTEHFLFEQPISVTVSYARCAATYVQPIAAWYFDPVTCDLLEPMASVDNPLLRSVTFTTPHLSGYILAN